LCVKQIALRTNATASIFTLPLSFNKLNPLITAIHYRHFSSAAATRTRKSIPNKLAEEQTQGSSDPTPKSKSPRGRKSKATKKSLVERLNEDVVICAEGYLFELERRGYVQVGSYVPEVVLNYPKAVEELHREFLRAGSDVIEAFTYYAHREKLRLIGKDHLIEKLNRKALSIAKKVAAEGNALVAGNICNSTIYTLGDKKSHLDARDMFEEQVKWAKDEGVDFIIAETFDIVEEAMLALEVIKASGIPSVITMAMNQTDKFRDKLTAPEAMLALSKAGATVVGLNCSNGPATMLSFLRDIRKVYSGHLAALPVPFNTTPQLPTMQALCPVDKMYTVLEPHTCTRYQMADFAVEARKLGVNYIGVCCGGAPHHIRSMAEALGRKPVSSAFSPDLSKHYALGTDKTLNPANVSYKMGLDELPKNH